jgi:hypothetical protein
MKLHLGMHIGLHLVFFGKAGVTFDPQAYRPLKAFFTMGSFLVNPWSKGNTII